MADRPADRPADPLADTTWLLVDGNNLLHKLSTSKSAAPRSALIGRLRGAIPTDVAIDVVFDGPAERGLRGERIASGLRVRYGGGRSADALLVSLVDEVRLGDGPMGTAGVLVVTDDAALRRSLANRGARTAGTTWLLGRLERADRTGRGGGGGTKGARPTSIGAMTPPRPIDLDPDAADRPGWKPGRGATTKRGNPRRTPRHRSG